MDRARSAPFAEALGLLQGMLGERVQVVLNLPGYFFDCGFSGRLERVVTLAEHDGPVLLVLEDAHGIALDPAELNAFVGRMPGRPAAAWLEFRIGRRAWLLIEPIERMILD
jgi:hypothetical protein